MPYAVPPRFIEKHRDASRYTLLAGASSRSTDQDQALTGYPVLFYNLNEGSSALTPGDVQKVSLWRALSLSAHHLCQLTPAYSSQTIKLFN